MLENQNSPLVSVIMIFLNAEKFIQEAVESVLSQTYSNWELILVDDGSSDASTEIAQRYARKYPQNMKYFEHADHQNRGMSASRNLGIRQSCGDYIAFLDADDVYLPQKIERQLTVLAAKPEVATVYGTTQYWYSWTGEPDDQSRDTMRRLGVRADTTYQPPELTARYLQNTARTPTTCSVLIRRKAIESIGGFEEHFTACSKIKYFFTNYACMSLSTSRVDAGLSTGSIRIPGAMSVFKRGIGILAIVFPRPVPLFWTGWNDM